MPLNNPDYQSSTNKSYVGSSIPTNSKIGDRWLELNNGIFTDWVWDGTSWITISRQSTFYTEGTGTKLWNLPLSGDYHYKILSWQLWLFSSIAMNSINYLSPSLKLVANLQEQTIFTFSQPTINAGFSKYLFSSTLPSINTTASQEESLQVTLSRVGNVSFRAASSLTYQLRRK
jgi:hypothetical protein